MRGLNAEGLIGRIYAMDHGVKADGQTDDARAIQAAILAGRLMFGSAGGVVVLPPGVVTIGSTVLLYSNMELEIPAGCTLQLLPGANCDMIANVDPVDGNSRIRISGAGVVDGNRTGQGAGNWHGIHFVNVTDARMDAGLTVKSCQGCGVLLSGCTRPETDVVATDNGLDGVDLLNTVRGVIRPRAYDNCRVAAAGTADGVHLEGASTDNVIVSPVCYDTLGAAGRQGYGVREDAASNCDRNRVVGGSLAGNATGAVSLIGVSSENIDANLLVFGAVGDITAEAFGAVAAAGASGKVADAAHVHAMPANPLQPGVVTNSMLAADVYQSGQFVNEIKGWPAVVNSGDLDALNLWWHKVGTPTAGPSVVSVSAEALTTTYGQALKQVVQAAGQGFQQTWTYSAEPRVQAGRQISGLFAVWCVAGVGVTASFVNSDATHTDAAKVTAAGWTLVAIEGATLAGTSCSIQFTADGAGTFYVVPLGVCVGPRAMALPSRPTRWVDGTGSLVVNNVDPGGAVIDLDLTTASSALAIAASIYWQYINGTTANCLLWARRKGNTNMSVYILKETAAGGTFDGRAVTPLDDGQTLQFGTGNSQASDAEQVYGYLLGWEEWA